MERRGEGYGERGEVGRKRVGVREGKERARNDSLTFNIAFVFILSDANIKTLAAAAVALSPLWKKYFIFCSQ